MSLITTSNLSKAFGAEDIFSGIDLSIPPGARIGLVGVNGVGKTTLLRIMLGEEEPSGGRVQRAKNIRMGYLPQEAVTTSRRTLWEECLSALEDLIRLQEQLHKMETSMAEDPQNEDLIDRYGSLQHRFDQLGGFTFETDIERTLTGLGFAKEEYQKPLNILSGGQHTRAVLARLLLSNPDLLLLDEPTNHLDVQAMEWLEGFLKTWDGAALMVSHDRYFLDQTADHIWEMTPSLEIYRGNYSAYLMQREERYERQMKEFEAQQEFIAKEEDFIRRNMAGQNTRQAQGRLKRLERLLEDARLAPPQHSRRIHFEMGSVERSGDLVVRTYDLQVGYADDRKVLIHVPDLVLTRGECAAVMGPNGAGKTTFLKTLLGGLEPLEGKVKLGASVSVGYFSQAHEGLHPDWTLVKEIQYAAPAMLEPEARSYLAKFLFTGDDVFKQVNVLSGGERGRLALACLALQGANLLLLDEPTNHLDLPSQEILQRVIADFHGTVLLVSHDRYLVDAVATQVWELLPGERTLSTFKGNYSQMRAEQRELENRRKARTTGTKTEKTVVRGQEKKKSINPRVLRNLEEKISRLEEEIEIVSGKLENPLDAVESISDLGEQYNTLKKALDEKWNEWESLFQD
ncbi:MAG: ABC-F family ATP-binding cassette domain-containing protein [Chloroflexi bacterium]|nr:ABC-F family ATP-binding cassette domain-containing protein [Chloroflexota bacterium]